MHLSHLIRTTRLLGTLLAALGGATLSAAAAAPPQDGVLYSTGFEQAEGTPFTAGILQGQGNWTVTEGSAVVQQATKARGAQAVQAGQASFRLDVATNAPVLWVDAFVLDPGSTHQPMIPSNAASSVLFFSATEGILALDGDGSGNGNFVHVAPIFATNEFVRVSVRNDYVNQTYDVWINGARARSGLRFKDAMPGFSGMQRRSCLDSYLDDFSVTTWGLDADSDDDGLNDLDEVKFHGSHPLLADTDGDGMSDGEEILAGTDPASAASVFALGIESLPPGQHRVRVPTITGRHYTLQRRTAFGAGSWENVPGATDIAGDGTEKAFVQSSSGTNYFYHAIVNP